MYKGIRLPSGRTPRTIAEDKGTVAAGFAGTMEYAPETGTVLGAGNPAPQAYHDEASASAPTGFAPRGGSEKRSW